MEADYLHHDFFSTKNDKNGMSFFSSSCANNILHNFACKMTCILLLDTTITSLSGGAKQLRKIRSTQDQSSK